MPVGALPLELSRGRLDVWWVRRDFNFDGNNDYVLFNSSTRHTAIWYLSGVRIYPRRLWSDGALLAGR